MRKKTGNKLHTWEAALLLAVAAALLGACTSSGRDALEQKVIRLHVIANSDNEADQALKLRVRDRVLVLTEDILRQSRDMEEARQRLAEALPRLQQTAEEEIAAQGSRYTVSAGLEETEFPTREYDGLCITLRGVSGSAGGHRGGSREKLVVRGVPTPVYHCRLRLSGRRPSPAAWGGGFVLITEEDGGYVLRFRAVELWGGPAPVAGESTDHGGRSERWRFPHGAVKLMQL